jgi:hypothetical protein
MSNIHNFFCSSINNRTDNWTAAFREKPEVWTSEIGAAIGRGWRASWATSSAQTPAAGDGGQGAGRYAGRRTHIDKESRSGDGGGDWVLTGSKAGAHWWPAAGRRHLQIRTRRDFSKSTVMAIFLVCLWPSWPSSPPTLSLSLRTRPLSLVQTGHCRPQARTPLSAMSLPVASASSGLPHRRLAPAR